MQQFYIIKSAGAWMMDELVVFAELAKFNILFLRKQEAFYNDKIELLERKGINIIYVKNWDNLSFSKLYFCLLFTIRHLQCFLNFYSFVYGIKSIVYFFKMDLEIFKREQINLHCQFATQASILGLMIKEYFKTNVSYSFTYHAYDIYVKNLWFNTLSANAEKIFSISNYNLNYIFKHYKINDKSKIYYSPLGVFPPLINKRDGSGNVLRIGFLSYFVEMKGINYLLPAIKALKNSKISFSLDIAGDGPLKKRMVSYIKKNNLTENVKFHGLIKDKKKDLFYRDLDVFILPSISNGMETDGLPVVLMEAVSYGVPIISTNISGIPEICINDYNGYLIKQKSVEEIDEALLKFSKNTDKWSDFSQNSFEISKRYDITTNSGKKLNLLGWQ